MMCNVVLQIVHDWSQLPSATDGPGAISGSPMFAAVSVLEGGSHTESSMYEGLFYSLLSICRGGLTPDAWAFEAFTNLTHVAVTRRGVFKEEPPMDMWGVPEDMAPFMRALHALFWPHGERYRTDVAIEEVRNVCTQFTGEIPA